MGESAANIKEEWLHFLDLVVENKKRKSALKVSFALLNMINLCCGPLLVIYMLKIFENKISNQSSVNLS